MVHVMKTRELSYELQNDRKKAVPRGINRMNERIVEITPPDSAHVTSWLDSLSRRYGGWMEMSEIGSSLLGRGIHAVHIGAHRRKVLYCGGVHGREWITSLLLLYFMEELLEACSRDTSICGIRIRKMLESGGITFLPALNPDGIEISVTGAFLPGMEQHLGAVLPECCRSVECCRRWKANAGGVDINRNFDAGWDDMRCIAMERGISGPSPEGWTGEYPVSEPETRAVTELCERERFRHLIAFHSSGEEIYWNYRSFTPARSHIMARILAVSSGYSLSEPDRSAGAAGLKDWFMEKYRAPAFTVEVGSGSSPLPLSGFRFIYNRLREMLVLGIAI